MFWRGDETFFDGGGIGTCERLDSAVERMRHRIDCLCTKELSVGIETQL
jgi:hypothetical protein